MNIFYETIKKFNDFNSRINIKLNQLMPKYSISENIVFTYDRILDEKSKSENKRYIKIKEKFGLAKQEIESKRSVITKLEPLMTHFQDAYKKNYMEIEMKSISQKAYVRIKKEELRNYLASYELKLKEKAEISLKKEKINLEIESLKNRIERKCLDYIEEVSGKNIDNLKSEVLNISEELMKIPLNEKEISSEYVKTEEYLNSVSEFRQAYKKLYYFMSGVFKKTQEFIDGSNIEKILPDLVSIQDELKEKYNDFDRLELEDNKINDFLNLKEGYEEDLRKSEKELENIDELVNKDEKLIAIKNEIENYIDQYKEM